jgi:hypothetical protein
VFQVVVAVCAAIPAAVALLDLSAEQAAKISGIAGATVILVTAIQNALEAKGLVPTMLSKPGTVEVAQRLAPYFPEADPEPTTGAPDAGQSAVGVLLIVFLILVILKVIGVL